MNKICLVIVAIIFKILAVKAQPGVWTWMQGDSLPSTSCGMIINPNEPKCEYAAAHWTDNDGYFWIYGSSDLWRYNPQLNNWTHLLGISGDTTRILSPRGIYNAQNNPGYKINGVYTCTTSDNVLWMYGGLGGVDDCTMLWKYSIALNQWAWMGTYANENYGIKGIADSLNMPGCGSETNATWIDAAGNLWLFGAGNYEGNNMWKYDIMNGLWTWMSGSNNSNNGVYGNIGVPSVNNYPSSRWTNFYWKDDLGYFWIGLGHTDYGTDVWKFNPVTLEWTWMSGLPNASNCDPIGNLCENNTFNQIGRRFENRASWKVSDNLIITYAGEGCNGIFNDLWAYLPLESKWIKLGNYPMAGHIGIKGISDPLDFPRYRSGSSAFKDANNNCWLFGGRTPGVGNGNNNDLWKYEIDWNCLPSYVSSNKMSIENNFVSVYPNPASTVLHVSLKNSEYAENVRIIDTYGHLFVEITKLTKGNIDISALPFGIYLIEVEWNGSIFRKLWLKM